MTYITPRESALSFVFVALFTSSLAAQPILHTRGGDAKDDELGHAVAGAGDVNGDGFADVIAGAWKDDDTGDKAGTARVYSGVDGTTLYTFFGVAAGDEFGTSVAGAGDVNGDGFDDLIVGAPKADDNGGGSGHARVFSGRDGSPLYTFSGASGGDEFGTSVAGAGDVNGDGFDDLIVGAPKADDNGGGSGHARVFSGRDGSPLYTFAGASGGDELGRSVAGAGDVNGDGFDDLIVGAPKADDDGGRSGHARVFSGVDGALLYTFAGASGGDEFGTSVAGAGDVDGDLHADLIVGAPKADVNGGSSGSACVLSGADGSILYTFHGDSGSDEFGRSTSGAGDVDGDGYADLVVGAPKDDNNGGTSGSARVFSGFDGSVLHTFDGDSGSDELGTSVAGMGDANGDGFDDVVAGAPKDDAPSDKSGSVKWLDLGFTGNPPVARPRGAPCAGGSGNLPRSGHVGTALIGRKLRVTVRGAAPNSPLSALALGDPITIPLDLIGMAGCTLYNNPWTTISLGTDALGMASFDFDFPVIPASIGYLYETQWFVPDIGAPYALPLTMSDALTIVIGG